jgi:hypothetical protein
MFKVLQPPVHGTLDLAATSPLTSSDLDTAVQYSPASAFTMHDIYENRVSYRHDGSEQFTDSFTFTVSDGTNHAFTMQNDQPRGPALTQADLPPSTPRQQLITAPQVNLVMVIQSNLS